jgi:hypothetical protein
VLFSLYLIVGSPVLAIATVTARPRVHESETARAATRQILGPDARVGGRWGSWYASGAAHWFNTERDLLHRTLLYDPATYFSNVDAFAEYPHMSDSSEYDSLSSWYAGGTLKLRGFYFGETNNQLQLVLLSAQRPPRLAGYAADRGRLIRFEESAGGDYAVVSAACPPVPELDYGRWGFRWAGTFSSVLQLPRGAPDYPKVVLTLLVRRGAPPSDWIARSCRVIQEVSGMVAPVDRDALLAAMKREDRPIRFYRYVEQMPGFKDAGMPKDAARPENTVRLDALDLPHADAYPNAAVAAGPPVRVTTDKSFGGFSASIPVKTAQPLSGAGWVHLRLHVLSGRIRYVAFNRQKGILASTRSLSRGSEPRDLFLAVPDLRQMDSVIVFNDEEEESSQVEILDAAVLVARQTDR